MGVAYRTIFPFILGTLGFVGAFGYTKKDSMIQNILLFGAAASVGFGIAELTSWGTFKAASASARASPYPMSAALGPSSSNRTLGDNARGITGAPDVAYTYSSPAGRFAQAGTHSSSYAYGTKIAVSNSIAHPSGQGGLGGGNYGTSAAALPIDNPIGRTAPEVPFDVFLLIGGQGGKHH
jgi:hypothetical protein